MDAPLPSPSGTSIRSNKPSVPLLLLAPPALALGNELAVGEPGDDNNAGEIWNVITRAADLVKDGERLENLAWRHWGQPRRTIQETTRRLSMSSQATSASSASIHTPIENSTNVPFLHRTRSAERLTFGGALRLLLEKDENNFKDWIEDAKKHSYPLPVHPPPPPPTISVPDTPIANVEIRLVEPTPVPSRVGSLGGSMSTSGLLHSTTTVPPALKEDVIGEERATIASSPVEKEREKERFVRIASTSTPIGTPRRSSKSNSPKKKNSKFFVQSSPSKGSGSDSSHPSHHSPVVPTPMKNNNLNNNGAGPSLPSTLLPSAKHGRRRSSGDSSSGKGKLSELKDINNNAHGQTHPHGQGHGHQKRHVSLSTMRGKYHAEKRRMAEQHSAMTAAAENDNKDNEESGWEDEEEDMGEDDDEDGNWSDEEDSPKVEKTDQHKAPRQETSEVPEKEHHKVNHHQQQKPSLNRRTSSSKSQSRMTAAPKMGRTTSDDHHGQDLLTLLTSKSGNRRSSQGHSGKDKDAPPPPAPTPLTKMSKKERQKAAAERAKIEAELEAQRQREMFAKQQIFGSRHNQGLLASALQRGASMVNLQTATDGHSIRPSPTHGQLPSLASSPAPGPVLLRSKSVVAMPVQTGVSVTIPPHALNAAKDKKAQKNSQERAKASVELESSSDEESDADADYLNTTQTKQKLAALAAKRDAKTQNQVQTKAQAHSQSPNQTTSSNVQQQQQQQQPLTQALPAGPRINEFGYVQPMTPTTRRRNIIMAEMSESLRRNVVLEREKSSGGGPRALGLVRPPPSTHTSKLPTHRSAINLTQYSRGGGGGETMERTSSHPARASPNTSQPSSHTGAITTLPPPPSSTSQTSMPPPPPPTLEGSRRRTTPNILGGGNFLRPLTRATIAQPPPPLQPPPKSQSHTQSNLSIGRNSSTTNCTMIDPESQRSESPSSMNLEAPAMMRRSTEGDDLHRERERRRELARRRDTTDTSYRLHGW
ncbi:hypothetical protein I204_07812 [Kwoniella mangroviensis CBS 8886]|nr:hypothetical protein I204_07812 [Kwoniella mangroviensis CBS 8886]